MSELQETGRPSATTPSRVGMVVHPSRAVDGALEDLRRWADRDAVELVQVGARCEQQKVAASGDAGDCDLIVSIGGDGTMLAALRTGSEASRPVLGVACGSLGVLTSIPAGDLGRALQAWSSGEWVPRALPALAIARDHGDQLIALNDLALVRAGEGQIRVTASVDGTLYGRIAGDGCVVSTPMGSSAYALAAGGPLLAPDNEAFLLTPLPTHGGAIPPLVLRSDAELRLEAMPGHGGGRLEIDGQVVDTRLGELAVTFRPNVATIVTFSDQEPFLTGLRRLRVVIDSPRILAEHDRR